VHKKASLSATKLYVQDSSNMTYVRIYVLFIESKIFVTFTKNYSKCTVLSIELFAHNNGWELKDEFSYTQNKVFKQSVERVICFWTRSEIVETLVDDDRLEDIFALLEGNLLNMYF
jgi:hypothetical protein